ncbi:fimbrial protein [Salmonella enterica]|nr:fimbrial protein [Salmonella enterica]
MKKTLIALAVAASAVVSGSAMAAWTPDFVGNGEVNLGGTLTPEAKVTVWETQIGTGNQGLNGKIEKGRDFADINVSETIPFIGIRTKLNTAFSGQYYMSPNIDYKGAVDLNTFEQSKSTLTLDVKNKAGEKIGTMTAPFYGAGVVSWKDPNNNSVAGAASAYAPDSGKAFFGGVPSDKTKVSEQSADIAKGLIADIADKFDAQGSVISGVDYIGTAYGTYSGYYAGGIMKNSAIRIKLEQPAQSDAIEWKASLPITVSYN